MSSAASKLDQLRGLDGAKHAVRKLLSTKTESHAVLFYGAPGAGKRSLAQILAQGWLCVAGDGSGCGECKACRALERDNHPDILRIQPIGPSSLIKIGHFLIRQYPPKDEEHILPVETFFRTPPLVSRHKVVIVEDAHRMNADACNAFLKTLEEPPPYGRIVMTTPSVGRLPATILSRCLAIACELPKEASDGNEDMWRLASGAPGRAARLSSQAETYLAIDRFAHDLATRPAAEALIACDQFRAIAESIQVPGGARAVNAEAVATLAAAIQHHHPNRPAWALAAVEAHRRILGNGSAAYTLDALFTKILVN